MYKSVFIAFQFLLNYFLVHSPSGVYNFYDPQYEYGVFSLILQFCLKIYPSEDVALELPES